MLVVLTISRLHQNFPAIAKMRPAALLTGFVLVYAVLARRSLGDGRWLGRWPAKAVIGLGVMACLSALFGVSLGSSAKFILDTYWKVLVLCLILMAALRSTKELSAIIWAYVLGCGILAWLALTVFQLHATNTGFERLAGMYMYDANDAGLILTVGLPLTLLLLQTASRYGKIVAVVILVGIGVTIARTGSRGAFLGIVVVGLFILFTLPGVKVAMRLGFLAVAGLSLALTAPPGYWQQMETMTTPREDYNWNAPTGRRQIAIRGLHYLEGHPVFGIGIGNFARAEGLLSDRARHRGSGDPGIKWSAPHNSFLEAGVELGPIGFVLWTSLILGGIIGLRRLRRRLPRGWVTGDGEQRFLYLATVYLPIALVGFAVTSFFVSFAFLDPIYILAAMVTGLQGSVESRLRADGLLPATAGERRNGVHARYRIRSRLAQPVRG